MAVTDYNPSDYTVDEVNAYLASADSDEVDRVLAAEAADKNRSTVHGPSVTTQGDDFATAAAKATPSTGEAYEKGYFGEVPSRDGDNPEDLTIQGVTGQNAGA